MHSSRRTAVLFRAALRSAGVLFLVSAVLLSATTRWAAAHAPGARSVAAVCPAPPSSTPIASHGDSIPNVAVVESRVKVYYGSEPATYPGVGDVTIPSRTGSYAKEVAGIEARAKSYLAGAIKHRYGSAKPALVFDIDDTTLNTYDYEVFVNFAYTKPTNATFVENAAFPEVYGMPGLVNWAAVQGYTVFFLTGRPEAQRGSTVKNLGSAGYTVPLDEPHVFLALRGIVWVNSVKSRQARGAAAWS